MTVEGGPVSPATGLRADDASAVVLAAYQKHQVDLFSFATALVRERETAEDVVAEAFLRLVREVKAGREPDDLRGWLYRVVANLVLSRGRRIATAKRFLTRLVERRNEPSPEARVVGSEVRQDLLDALAVLPADGRIAIVMLSRGATGREIAAAIGRSEAATRTLICRTRIRLRERLEEGVRT
jgi:RNA polymerase sigma-70 factor (ECF subfamily)